jgi:hypothetical protein
MNLQKIGKVFASKSVGTWPSCYKKKLPGRGLTKVEKHWSIRCMNLLQHVSAHIRGTFIGLKRYKRKIVM